MAAAAIFGALSGLGNLGEQKSQARQIADDEVVNRLAQQQTLAQVDLQRQEAQQRMAEGKVRMTREQQQTAAGKQPVMIGNPFTAGNGKQYARFQDPITGALSLSELPGGTEETAEEKMFRGLKAIGFSDEDARQATNRKAVGKETQYKEILPDVSSPTGFSEVHRNAYGQELWRTPSLAPRYMTPTEISGSSTDPYGLTTTHTSVRKPLLPGMPSTPGGTLPVPAASPTTRTPQGAPVIAQRGPAPPAVGPPAAAGGTPPVPAGPVNMGPYRGLDASGQIPARPELNPMIAQYANDILAGRDVNKIPQKVRPLAESLAQRYGWKGQGSLTPAQQMQIEQVDNSLAAISTPQALKLFNSPWALVMSTVPIDPTTEGGTKGLMAALQRRGIPQPYADYMDQLIRLRGVISGIRGFTGANNSNATADRLLAELPNFSNTKNSADAATKLEQLRREVAIIKRLGYFLPERPAGGGAPTTPADLPPPGATVRDFSQIKPQAGP